MRYKKPLEKDYSDVQKIVEGGLTYKEALSKLKLKQPSATVQEKYQNLVSVWQQENMRIFKDFLRWYNNKHVVPTLETVQKMVDFYHNKGINIIKHGCTLPNLQIICLQKSTTAKFYSLAESDTHF